MQRFPETLLFCTAGVILLLFLLPINAGRTLTLSVLLAFLMIGILLLHGTRHPTPYSSVVTIGAVLTLVYLVTFSAFSSTVVAKLLPIALAAFHFLMAVLFTMYVPAVEHKVKKGWIRRAFRKGLQPIRPLETENFHRGMEPLPVITKDHLHRLGVYDSEKKGKRS